MAITVDVQDLENFPGNVKRVTVDQTSVVAQGQEGDEQYVFKFSTTAYSNITDRTAIQDYYMTNLKVGWARSSGFTGNSGQFSLTASVNRLMVKIDSTVSGTSNGYYEIILDYNEDTTPMSGVSIAADMETKIRAINLDTVDAGYALAYKNTSVEYKEGKFWVVSGSVSNYYTGNNRSYVDIISGSTHDALAILGFDLGINSATLATASIKEALVTSGYIHDTGVSGITIDQNIGAVEGNCLMITDRDNTDYFQLDVTPIDGVTLNFSSTAITHTYFSNVTKVQLLKEQDPDAGPTSWFDNIDKVTRHGIKTMINSIDFSE